MTSTVLVVTALDDTTADAVIERLVSTSVRVARFDVADFPQRLNFQVSELGLGSLATPTRKVWFNDVRSVYWRRPTPVTIPQDDAAVSAFAEREARAGFVATLKALPCLHINHPDVTRRAENKPMQLQTAYRLGFLVPPTVLTNRPEQAKAFIRTYGPVVYKSLAPPEIDRDGKPLAIWTEAVTAEEITDAVAGTAHLFQAKVGKVADVRLTVVGNEMFAVRIDAPHLDWRRDYDELIYKPVEVPEDIASKVMAYLKAFSLNFGCFDFALTGDGAWAFLECNPSGQWAWLEDETGLPISEAISNLLVQGEVCTEERT